MKKRTLPRSHPLLHPPANDIPLPSRLEALASGIVGLMLCGLIACGEGRETAVNEPGAPAETSQTSLPGDSERPAILLVTIDTLRADHLGAYGYSRDTSPHLDRLAEEGAVFGVVYAPTGATCPSHATLFTSRSPMAHGVVRNGFVLQDREKTLAEILQATGWQTGAFVSSYPLKSDFGFGQGFEHFDGDFNASEPTFVQPRWEGKKVKGAFDRRGDVTVDRAISWLEKQGAEAPIFLWAHLFDPHAPYAAPGPDRTRYTSWTDDPVARDVALYDAEIRFADAQVARLQRAFEQHAGSRPTLIVATSDHGEGLHDHGYRTHNRDLFDEEVRVPLVVRWTGHVPPGLRIDEPAHLIDLAPTLLGLLGIDPPSETRPGTSNLGFFDGQDLSPLLLGGEVPGLEERVLWLQRAFYRRGRRQLGERGWGLGLRKGRWKYIEARAEGRRELYDLVADPDERRSLAEEKSEFSNELSARLTAWRKREFAERRSGTQKVRPEQAEALRALGYVE
ncbi:MAG: sulfatase-like hydrolase/transferase [bacterium]|nr:sulfatase-like hydrolase/transferase [bacterium]